MEALRDEAVEGVEVGAGAGPGRVQGRDDARVEPLGRELPQPATGAASETRERLQIREEELLRSVGLSGRIRTAALLLDAHEEPGMLQEPLSDLRRGSPVGCIESFPLARREPLGQGRRAGGEP